MARLVTLSAWGASVAMRIPKQIIEKNNWQIGDKFALTQQDNGFTVKKVRTVKHYDLAEILDGIEHMPKEDIVDWGEPKGREVW